MLAGKFLLLAAMLAELRETTEEKIVVVSNFTATLDLIEAYCKRKKYPYCRLDGCVCRPCPLPPAELKLPFHPQEDASAGSHPDGRRLQQGLAQEQLCVVSSR